MVFRLMGRLGISALDGRNRYLRLRRVVQNPDCRIVWDSGAITSIAAAAIFSYKSVELLPNTYPRPDRLSHARAKSKFHPYGQCGQL